MRRLFIFLITIICFCKNPFTTREPESPSEERSTWLQPIMPERVIDNLKFSIQEANLANYMKCLVESNSRFRFLPDAFVKANNYGFFDNWNLTSEQNYLTKIFTATYDSLRKVTFGLPTLDYQVDSVLIQIDYELELHHNLSESYPKFIKGQADFWLSNINGEWYITQWSDYGTETVPSWSSIKAIFGK